MWAQCLVAPYQFEVVEVPTPTEADLTPGQVVVRTTVTGICGSDLPFFKGRMFPAAAAAFVDGRYVSPPGIPTHEVAGIVVASRDESLPVGAAVVGWANGGLAEYVVAEGSGLLVHEERWRPEEAIILQPLACILHALDQLEPKIDGARAAVLGQGPMGVLFSHALKNRGASHVIGVDRVDRSDFAATFGVDAMVHMASAQWAAELHDETERPALVIEAVGHQPGTLVDAISALALNGHVYYFGIPDDEYYVFPLNAFLRKVGTFSSGWTLPGPSRRAALEQAEGYLGRHPDLPGRYVTTSFPMADATEAFRRAIEPAVGQMKIVLHA
jgi:L-iditol 2-dehydrogenase